MLIANDGTSAYSTNQQSTPLGSPSLTALGYDFGEANMWIPMSQGARTLSVAPALIWATIVVYSALWQVTAAEAQVSGAIERSIARRATTKEAERAAILGEAKVRTASRTERGDYLIGRWNNALCKAANPCPLPEHVGRTFKGGTYEEVVLAEDTMLYRSYADPEKKFGAWWKREPSMGTRAVIDNAIPTSEEGNVASRLTRIRVPKGTTVYEGLSGPYYEGKSSQMANVGGKPQVFIPSDTSSWEFK